MNYWTPNLVAGSRAEEAARREATGKIEIGSSDQDIDTVKLDVQH